MQYRVEVFMFLEKDRRADEFILNMTQIGQLRHCRLAVGARLSNLQRHRVLLQINYSIYV